MATILAMAESRPRDQTQNQRDIITQSIISIVFGLIAFLAFCVSPAYGTFWYDVETHWSQLLRPRWTEIYAARKRQKNAASRLPELPDTFFGWMPVLYRISEQEVLASAGLDAFVVRIPLHIAWSPV